MAQTTQLADYLQSLRQKAPDDISYPAALGMTPQTMPNAFTARPNVQQADQGLKMTTGTEPTEAVNLPAEKMPNAFSGAASPKVQLDPNPLNQIEGHEQNQLNKLQTPGKAWGDRSTLGKVGHVLGVAGNIAGNIFAPEVMANIPGTMLNRQMRESKLTKDIEGVEEQKSREGLESAQAENQGSDAAKSTEETKEMPGKSAAEEGMQNAEAAKDQAAVSDPGLATAYAHAVNQAIKEGRDPAQDPIVAHLSDAITSIQKTTGTNKTIQREVNGKPHTVMVNEQGNDVRDLGETGEKPTTVNVNTAAKEAKQDRATIYKTYTPVMDSAERFNVMAKNYEDAVKNHDQQAMLSLLYNHMGMTMGLQKGAKMTQDLIREAQRTQPWLQGMVAKFDSNGYLSGVTLSKPQMLEMVQNAQGRYQEDVVKARNEAGYLGSKDDGPARTPNASTVNYYMGKAGGDMAKAKQMAADDGWTVSTGAKK